MNDIVEKVYHGFNNSYDLKDKFYDYLSKELRNESNKFEFLNQLIADIELEYINHQGKCDKLDEDCGVFKLKKEAIKIVNAKILEMEEDKNSKPIVNVDNSVNKNVVQDSVGVTINQNSNNQTHSNSKEETFFQRNVQYIYYTAGVIAFGCAFYKWLLPLI